MFTAKSLVALAQDRSPRAKGARLSPDLIARQAGDAILEVVDLVVDADIERLLVEEIIENEDLTLEPDFVDLTYDGLLNWHTIDAIDWRSKPSGSFPGQVAVGTYEARHRVSHELAHYPGPVGVLFDGQSKLRKLSGWKNVDSIRVAGVPMPTEIDQQTLDAEFPYPDSVRSAAAWKFLILVAPHVGFPEGAIEFWSTQYASAIERATMTAQGHVSPGAVIEDVPHIQGW